MDQASSSALRKEKSSEENISSLEEKLETVGNTVNDQIIDFRKDRSALEKKVEERHFLGGWIRFIFSKISKRIQADKIWWTLVLEIPQHFAISARLCPFCRSSLIFSVSAI